MRYVFRFLMALAVLAFAACADNDGNCVEPVDVAGEWLMTATPIEDTCDGDPYALHVRGDNHTRGKRSGWSDQWSYFAGNDLWQPDPDERSFSEYGVTSTVNLQLTASADGNSVEGSDSWNWTDGLESCGGSESLSGTRIDAPPGWTCPVWFYGTADGCDCGCGALDPDCIDVTVASCEYCDVEGSCSPAFSGCPGDIDPAQNWLCEGGTAVCGNDVAEPPEQCDGVDLQGLDCTDFGFTDGALACTADCTFDTSGCTSGPVCGDNVAQAPEIRDGTDLAGLTCADFGFTGGTLACNATCNNVDVTGCTSVASGLDLPTGVPVPPTDATAAAASSIRTASTSRWLRASTVMVRARAAQPFQVVLVTSTRPRTGFARARASVRTDVGAFEVQP